MNELMSLLFNADPDFFVQVEKYTSYEVATMLAESADGLASRRARALLNKASLREPMDFDMEVKRMYFSIYVNTKVSMENYE